MAGTMKAFHLEVTDMGIEYNSDIYHTHINECIPTLAIELEVGSVDVEVRRTDGRIRTRLGHYSVLPKIWTSQLQSGQLQPASTDVRRLFIVHYQGICLRQ